VSGGVKITATQSFSTVSGTIHVAPVFISYQEIMSVGNVGGPANVVNNELNNGYQLQLPNNLAAMANLPGYKQYPMSALEEDEIVVLFKRYGQEALDFKPTTQAWGCDDRGSQLISQRYGDAATTYGVGHYAICVFIDGCLTSTGTALPAATQVAEVEIRYHYECQANPTAIAFAGLGGPSANTFTGVNIADVSPPYQPLLMAAADNLAMKVPAVRCVDDSGIEEGSFISEAIRLWGNACAVASSVSSVVRIGSGILGALAV